MKRTNNVYHSRNGCSDSDIVVKPPSAAYLHVQCFSDEGIETLEVYLMVWTSRDQHPNGQVLHGIAVWGLATLMVPVTAFALSEQCFWIAYQGCFDDVLPAA